MLALRAPILSLNRSISGTAQKKEHAELRDRSGFGCNIGFWLDQQMIRRSTDRQQTYRRHPEISRKFAVLANKNRQPREPAQANDRCCHYGPPGRLLQHRESGTPMYYCQIARHKKSLAHDREKTKVMGVGEQQGQERIAKPEISRRDGE